nr:protein kinase-like domain, concanavalin A-like lectin/glucanase domain protein [Tanacetum cinerariifolium]
NFSYVVYFMIVEDISSIIDPRLLQVVLGRPFIEVSNMTHDLPEGVVRGGRGEGSGGRGEKSGMGQSVMVWVKEVVGGIKEVVVGVKKGGGKGQRGDERELLLKEEEQREVAHRAQQELYDEEALRQTLEEEASYAMGR